MPRACVGDFPLAKGGGGDGGKISPVASGTFLELSPGMFLRIRSDFKGKWGLSGLPQDQV